MEGRRRVLSYTTVLGGARDVDSADCWMVCVEVSSTEEEGSNIRAFSGREGQASGMAGRVSGGSMERTFWSLLADCWSTLVASSRASRWRWAICRGARILLPDHIHEYFSAFLRFCLSSSL